MAAGAEEQISEDGYFIPANLKHGRFTHFAVDNLDFHEHTKDGTTLHATTHNVYQYLADGEMTKEIGGDVPLVKNRKVLVKDPQPFYVKQSNLSLKERQKSRSLAGLELPQPSDSV
jgi:hypothetical protein